MSAVIGATHVLCAIGSGTDQVWAAARAGIARVVKSHVLDRHSEPISMGLVPEAALGTLTPEIDKLPLPARARRLLQLAAPSLQTVATGIKSPVPLFLGLPELAPDNAQWLKHLPTYLKALTDVPVDRERSVLVPLGRAAALIALERALEFLESGQAERVIVGGVDTYLDLQLLADLDAERRLLGQRVMDGFIPGEGAAFFALSRSLEGREPGVGGRGSGAVTVLGAASFNDPGHRYGDAPARGEGLSHAIESLRGRLNGSIPPIATTFAGFNGESFESKLWGVAQIRHRDMFAPGTTIEHPADKFGDTGATAGAILVALAAKALATGTRSGPALVWSASDREPRACAVVSASAS